jgi:hypothetical protein
MHIDLYADDNWGVTAFDVTVFLEMFGQRAHCAVQLDQQNQGLAGGPPLNVAYYQQDLSLTRQSLATCRRSMTLDSWAYRVVVKTTNTKDFPAITSFGSTRTKELKTGEEREIGEMIPTPDSY